MKDKSAWPAVALAALLSGISGCCSAPAVDLAKYESFREDPAETVRYFQLAVETGYWKEAASCLLLESEEVGSWELWIAAGKAVPELGGLSLTEIVVGTYLIQFNPVTTPGVEDERTAVVTVLSRPRPEIDQAYHLVLVRRERRWSIDLDKTFEFNQPPE